MDAMTFLGFISVVTAGGVIFAAVMAFLDSGLRKAQDERARGVEEPAVTALPSFFATAEAKSAQSAVAAFDDALLEFLVNHVKAEQAMASKFVHFPSVDSLYQQARPSPRATMH